MASSTIIYSNNWTYLTLENGFENFNTSEYESLGVRRLSPTIAQLYGVIKKSTTSLPSTLIAQLPIGFYPKNRLINFEKKVIISDSEHGRFDILTNGRIEFIYGDTGVYYSLQILYPLC